MCIKDNYVCCGYSLEAPRWLTLVVHSDVCPTGDQEVIGPIPTGSDNILSLRLIMKYFLRSFSFFCWFKRGSCRFLRKLSLILYLNWCEILLLSSVQYLLSQWPWDQGHRFKFFFFFFNPIKNFHNFCFKAFSEFLDGFSWYLDWIVRYCCNFFCSE